MANIAAHDNFCAIALNIFKMTETDLDTGGSAVMAQHVGPWATKAFGKRPKSKKEDPRDATPTMPPFSARYFGTPSLPEGHERGKTNAGAGRRWPRATSGNQPVTAWLCHKDLRIGRVDLDLLAQPVNMGFQRMGRNTGVIAPYLIQQRVTLHHSPSGLIEKF